MSVLKDVFCSSCGAVSEAVMEPAAVEVEKQCPACGERQCHVSRCTGGTGVRYFFRDMHARRWSDEEVSIDRVGVEYEGEECKDERGVPYAAAPQYSDDARNERRSQLDAAAARRRGLGKIYSLPGR